MLRNANKVIIQVKQQEKNRDIVFIKKIFERGDLLVFVAL